MRDYGPSMYKLQDVLGERSHENSVDFDQKDDEIYVNIMDSEAVVISLEEDPPSQTKTFHAVYYRWDRTHGVEEEHWIGQTADEESIADLVLAWIERYEKAQSIMAAEMEKAFGGGE